MGPMRFEQKKTTGRENLNLPTVHGKRNLYIVLSTYVQYVGVYIVMVGIDATIIGSAVAIEIASVKY